MAKSPMIITIKLAAGNKWYQIKDTNSYTTSKKLTKTIDKRDSKTITPNG